MATATELAMAADPSLIMELAGMPPDAWQADVIRKRPHNLLLNCSRQAGKSSTVAAGVVDNALNPGTLTLILSPSERQSIELLSVVKGIYGRIGMGAEDVESESGKQVRLTNGSRIVALPGGNEGNVRGFSAVSLLIVDEAARVSEDLYRAVRPMLAVSKGKLWVLSTPFGKRGFFFKEWSEGGADWERVSITADQCPRIPASFLAKEKRSMPEQWFRQEYYCEFCDTAGAVFRYDDVQAALRDDVLPLFPGDEIVGPLSGDVQPLFQ